MDPEVENYSESLADVGSAVLAALAAMEQVQRRLHPPAIEALRSSVRPFAERLSAARERFSQITPPPPLEPLHQRLAQAAELTAHSLSLFVKPAAPDEAVARIIRSLRSTAEALEVLYSIHQLPPISRFFVEKPFQHDIAGLDPQPREGIETGLMHTSGDDESRAWGGFSLYVPERYDGSEARPLVVALHGGMGHGREFIWQWLREARGRQFLLLAPTSQQSTWALMGSDVDTPALYAALDYVRGRWRVDADSILLTGLSDGATYALLHGLRADSPYTAIAPFSGVLHPENLENGNLERAKGRRIYMVHGALDWMFPVATARMASETLKKAGARLVYREIADLSHTYDRDENDRVLSWFDKRLALPPTE